MSEPTIEQLREAAARAGKLAEENEGLQRKLVFTQAGIDTSSPLGTMFADSYKGELNVDAVKASWDSIVPASNTTSTPEPEEEEEQETTVDETKIQEQEDRSNLTGGGAGNIGVETPPGDPIQVGMKRFNEEMASGVRRETAAATVFAELIAAANRGDERAIVKDN